MLVLSQKLEATFGNGPAGKSFQWAYTYDCGRIADSPSGPQTNSAAHSTTAAQTKRIMCHNKLHHFEHV